MDLHLNIDFNPPLNEIVFYGNSQFSSDSLRHCFSDILERPVNCRKMRSAVEKIIRMYRTKGLSLARVDRINYNEHDKSAHLYIFEGLVKSVHVSGLLRALFDELENQVHHRDAPG